MLFFRVEIVQIPLYTSSVDKGERLRMFQLIINRLLSLVTNSNESVFDCVNVPTNRKTTLNSLRFPGRTMI